jgi:CDP-glycerol glycerophosphotransferase
VFAWNKLFRVSAWRDHGLSWPEDVRYEDQPTTTRAYLAGRFDVIPDVVYHWRIRHDGSSITRQRASVEDLRDRWLTKRMALDAVEQYDDPGTSAYFIDRVLAGDLHRYFTEIPGAPDEWWHLLVDGVHDLWGERSLVHSGLPPVHRLVGWLVEQGRREDAASVVRWVSALDGPAPRADGHLLVPAQVLDTTRVAPEALALREHER